MATSMRLSMLTDRTTVRSASRHSCVRTHATPLQGSVRRPRVQGRRRTGGGVSCAAASGGEGGTPRLPPGPEGFLIGLRESIAYLGDPDGFIAERKAQYGDIFTTNIFFKPTVVVGGLDNVKEFRAAESAASSTLVSSLPEGFVELHTEYGALNLSGKPLEAARSCYFTLLDPTSLATYLPAIDKAMTKYADRAAAKGSTALAAELTEACLGLFHELFLCGPIDEETVGLFKDYNAGLLALLGKMDPSWKKGKAALDTLTERTIARVTAAKAAGKLEEPAYRAWKLFSEGRDESGAAWAEERVAVASVLFVWGAYIEAASLCARAVIELQDRPELAAAALAEAEAAGVLAGGAEAGLEAWELPYINGILRECLRTGPPAGGGYRQLTEPLELAGYEIPAGYVVTGDPRLSNLDASVFPQPSAFEPERWVPSSSGGSKCPFAGTAAKLPAWGWFPGGIGTHQCPGLPLAELVGRVFLVRWLQKMKSWKTPEGAPAEVPYTLIPIKIPTDEYTLEVAPRAEA